MKVRKELIENAKSIDIATPEEKAWVDGYVDCLREIGAMDVDRLRELAEADKDGRVVVLPCNRGDRLWTYCTYPRQKVYSFVVSDISTLNGRTMLNAGMMVVDARDIGKTVFLTREEAEKALEEAKRDG